MTETESSTVRAMFTLDSQMTISRAAGLVNRSRKAVSRARLAVQCHRRRHKTSQKVITRRLLVVKLAKMRHDGKAKFMTLVRYQRELAVHGFCVSRDTICRDLHFAGWRCRVRPFVPTKVPSDEKKRYDFARAHRCTDSATLIFSDETLVTDNDATERTQYVMSQIRGSMCAGRRRSWCLARLVWTIDSFAWWREASMPQCTVMNACLVLCCMQRKAIINFNKMGLVATLHDLH